jgi:translocation and assembly module TamB
MEIVKKNPSAGKKSLIKKILKVFAWILGCLVFLIILVLILIQTRPVQNFARKKIVSYLENKLKTKVEIGKLRVKFPTSISLQNVLLEDRSKDTLLYGGELLVDISMFKLIKKDVEVQEISLNNIVLKIKRLPPDSVFNFQFIADAFGSSSSSASKSKDTSSVKINIDRILVNNTRIIYKDAVTGNDMDIAIGKLDTKISTFDPSHLLFDIPTITLKGLNGHFYQLEPWEKPVEKAVSEQASQPGNYLTFLNKEMNFSDINVAYKSEPSNLNTSLKIGALVLHPKTLDLKNSLITLNDASLENSDFVVQTQSKKSVEKPKDTVLTTPATPSFKIITGEVTVKNTNLTYDDESMPKAPKGMDFSHLAITGFALDAGSIQYSTDTSVVSLKSASFKEKSGFVLNNLTTDFEMTPTSVSLKNLDIVMPGSEIKKSAVITYPSLAALQKNPALLSVDIDIENSKINIKDIQPLLPPSSIQNTPLTSASTLYVDAKVTGKVKDLNFQKLILTGLSATNINVSGVVKGLPDAKKVYADLTINKFQTSRSDILSLVPKGKLPSTITLPEKIAANGSIKGNMADLNTNLTINTSLGDAKIVGSLVNITDSNKAQYNLALNASGLQLGTLMQNAKLGVFTGSFRVQGKGYNPAIANATFTGDISAVTLNSYTYRNIKADGSIANKIYKINASVNDPNIAANLSANGKFSGKYPAIQIKATIDSIKTFPLHLTPDSISYHGDIDGDFTNTDPDNLNGNLLVTHSILVNGGQRITLDSFQLSADDVGGEHRLSLQAQFISATIRGQYRLTQLADVFQQAINPYFYLGTAKDTAKVDPYHFIINAGIRDNAALRAFFPALTELKPITLNGAFASDSGWNLNMKVPYVVYAGSIINNAVVSAGTKDGLLAFNASLKQFKSGTSLNIYATTLDGTLQNNTLNFTLNVKDQKSVNKYTLSGTLAQPSPNNYTFSLKPGNILLEYSKWNINADNSIQYLNKDIIAHNFILSQGGQQLGLNSIGTGNNRPLQVDFKNFKIETITGFVESDSLLVNGVLNGNALVKNIQTEPTFTTDLTVDNLSIYQDTIGTFAIKVNNNVANTYHADVTLKGRGNDMSIVGDYLVDSANSTYDFALDIAALQMSSIEGFTKGGIKNARGFIQGKIALNGSLKSPNIDGKLSFNNTAFNVSAINNVFRIDQASIAIINNKGIELNNFIIRDTTNNQLAIGGVVNTTDFLNYIFDLTIKARHFQAINSTNKDNKLFYGKMIFSTDLSIKGTPTHPIVAGTFSIDDKTDFTVVMPQQDPGIAKREGIVRFVDYSATAEDSLLMMPYDSLNVSPLVGYDISVNITVSKEASFNLIVDAANGDFLKLKGSAQLTAGIDASGKITLVGSYEIDEGSYNLSFNFLKRNFIIQKGSRIVWTGEPTTAQIDITAIYIANTAPLDLVQAQITGDETMYKQKLPFEVHLKLQGELLKPLITFDIVLPLDKNYNVSNDIITTVQNALAQIREDPGEINKQVFALLLLNRFVGQNPFDNSGGTSVSAGTLAMQSVSRLLTEQLNALTQNLVAGVDINFDVATTQDFTTGSQQNRTDLNVGISKRLLSDRLTVTVGSDFELQGPQPANNQQQNFAGNISINYKLSKDGRYMLRAYRKNDYTDIIEGYVIETGIGFIISVDYNKFSEIFTSKEQRRKKREIKKDNKKDDKQEAAGEEEEKTITTPSKANENAN